MSEGRQVVKAAAYPQDRRGVACDAPELTQGGPKHRVLHQLTLPNLGSFPGVASNAPPILG
jgi:hypothetical protein